MYFCRPQRHSHKRVRVGKPRILSSIMHADLARRNSFPSAASPYGFGPRLSRSSFGVFDLSFNVPANNSPEILASAPGIGPSLALSGHGPCRLVILPFRGVRVGFEEPHLRLKFLFV